MPVTTVDKDPIARTLTITAEFEVAAERVWRLWADPRQLERWWGPPGVPLTVVTHELRPGGTVRYHVTGADGARISGWWRVRVVAEPRRLDFDLGTSGLSTVDAAMRVEDRPGGGTRMVLTLRFPTTEAMAELLAIGFDRGMATAVGRIDELVRRGQRAGQPAPGTDTGVRRT